jgi:hypothetical protein
MPGHAGGGGGGGGSGRKVFVANLNYQTEWQHLKDHFKSIGNGEIPKNCPPRHLVMTLTLAALLVAQDERCRSCAYRSSPSETVICTRGHTRTHRAGHAILIYAIRRLQ